MVRAVLVAVAVTQCFAEEDVYYHTQLLQTKMNNPQKVVKKTSFSLLKRLKAKTSVQARLMKLHGDPDGKDCDGPSPAEAKEACTLFYDKADDQGCLKCVMSEAKKIDPAEDFVPDPNAGMAKLIGLLDECVDEDNLLSAACQAGYGDDVGLMDCFMCGMICECKGVGPEQCDHDCHKGCMDMDMRGYGEDKDGEGKDEGGEEDEIYEAFKEFYGGPGPDDDEAEYKAKCVKVGKDCFDKMINNPDFATTENPEKLGFDTLTECADEGMGKKNSVTQACQAGYGEDVVVFDCFQCGMRCGCEPKNANDCDEECHGECMDEIGGKPDGEQQPKPENEFKPPDERPKPPENDFGPPDERPMPHENEFGPPDERPMPGPPDGERPKADGKPDGRPKPPALIQSKPESDVTDLMQTRKHLQKDHVKDYDRRRRRGTNWGR